MKFLMMVLVICSANFAFAGSTGLKLKKDVINLNTCYGVRGLDGVTINFYDDGTAYLNTMTFDKSTPDELVAYPYSKYNLYSRYYEYGTVQDSVETTWRVKGAKVYVRFGKKDYSVTIGFKNNFCY